MRKQYFFIVIVGIFLATILFGLNGCQSVNHSNTSDKLSVNAAPIMTENENEGVIQMIFHTGEAKQLLGFIKKDITELEKDSVIIAKVTILETKSNSDLPKESAIKLTDIRIDEVLKTDGVIKAGATKILIEYYRTEIYPDEPNQIHIFSSNDAKPLKQGQEYLLFLEKSPHGFGDYVVTGGFQGQYPINEKTQAKDFLSLTAEDLDFMPEVVNEHLWILSEQVFNKYLKQ